MIRARIEPNLKTEAERIFRALGLTASDAMNIFYAQVRLRNGLPFDVKIPNTVTRKTFDRTDRGKGLRAFKNKEALLLDLGLL